MNHWHIATASEELGVISVIHYDDGVQSILDYIDMIFSIYPGETKDLPRAKYLEGMNRIMNDDTKGYLVSLKLPTLSLYWTNCEQNPCTFNCYN